MACRLAQFAWLGHFSTPLSVQCLRFGRVAALCVPTRRPNKYAPCASPRLACSVCWPDSCATHALVAWARCSGAWLQPRQRCSLTDDDACMGRGVARPAACACMHACTRADAAVHTQPRAQACRAQWPMAHELRNTPSGTLQHTRSAPVAQLSAGSAHAGS